MFKNPSVEDRFNFYIHVGDLSYRAVVGGIRTVTLFRDRLNVGKLPARRKGRVKR